MRRMAFNDPFSGREGVFQFTMEHLEKQLLFRKEEDYCYGVNTLALATLSCPAKILCYCLMSNHFHLLMRGRFYECTALYDWVLGRLRSMLGRRYGISGLLNAWNVDISAVTDDRMFRNEVLYQIRNPYKARICSPLSYSWSSADVYFNMQRNLVQASSFRTCREERLVLETKIRIPHDWQHDRGRILNRYFVDYPYVEKRIGNSLSFFDGLRIYDLESVIAQAHGLPESVSFSDSEIMEKIGVICQQEYHVRSHHQLDTKTLFVLARSLARRFSCPKNQIARLLGLDTSTLDRLL